MNPAKKPLPHVVQYYDDFVPEKGQFDDADDDVSDRKAIYQMQKRIKNTAEGRFSGTIEYRASDTIENRGNRPVMAVLPTVRGKETTGVIMDFRLKKRVPYSHKVGNDNDQLPPLENQFEDAEGPEYERQLQLDWQKKMKVAEVPHSVHTGKLQVRIFVRIVCKSKLNIYYCSNLMF